MLMQHHDELRAPLSPAQFSTDALVSATSYNRPSLVVDVKKYQDMIDCPDLSEDQKREVLSVLWMIIAGFVELGFKLEEKAKD